MKQYVEMYVFDRIDPVFTRASATWVPSLLYPLMDKLAEWLESVTMKRCTYFRKSVIRVDSIYEKIKRVQADTMYQYTNRKPREIFIGEKEIRKLMSEPAIRLAPWDYIELNTEGTRLHGVKITVIPWMEGVLVV